MNCKMIGLMITLICCLALSFPPGACPQVTLYIGDGSGEPGSCATPVEISLENSTIAVKGISMDICEPGNTLIRLGCDTTPRAPEFSRGNKDFNCVTNELANGCVRVLLFSGQGHLIEPGSGPVFALKYGVFQEAGPAGGCITLAAENVQVAGPSGPLASVGVLAGQFCYFECGADADCNDGLFCNGVETCFEGACQPGMNPCPDDGLFCTGVEGCDETTDTCTQSGNPCKVACDEANKACLCSVDDDCDDGRFCNGAETCNGSFCLPGTNPCPPSSICDEDNDVCLECYHDSDCDDGVFCNGVEQCVSGSCRPAAAPRCPPLSTCDEANAVCRCAEDAQCDDGLYCNGVERCNSFSGTCDLTFSYFSDYPCRNCTPLREDCDCDESIDACLPVTVSVGDGIGIPGSAGNPVAVNLDTLFVDVNVATVDICDADNHLACTSCERAGRTPVGFSCRSAEQPNGCCRAMLYTMGSGVIEAGAGPILNISYSVNAGAPPGECRTLTVQNDNIATSNIPLAVNALPGRFCFGIGGGSIAGSAGGPAGVAAGSGAEAVRPGASAFGVAGEARDGGRTSLEDSATCPLSAAVDDQGRLDTLRSFRDNVLLKNIVGQIFVHLFYRNASELTAIIDQHHDMRERLQFLADEHMANIGEAASGWNACITGRDRKNVIDFLGSIREKGSPRLKADIDLVMEEFASGAMDEVLGIATEE